MRALRSTQGEAGFVLPLVLVVFLFSLFVGVEFSRTASAELRRTRSWLAFLEAEEGAESGLEVLATRVHAGEFGADESIDIDWRYGESSVLHISGSIDRRPLDGSPRAGDVTLLSIGRVDGFGLLAGSSFRKAISWELDNLARGRLGDQIAPDVTASSSHSGFDPRQAIDGDESTRWAGLSPDDQWIEVRWVDPVHIARVELVLDAGLALDPVLRVGEGGRLSAVEGTVHEVRQQRGRRRIPVTFVPRQTDRLRIEFAGLGSPPSIREILVYAPRSAWRPTAR